MNNNLFGAGRWETSDGRHLNVSEMHTNHIINSLAKLKREREFFARTPNADIFVIEFMRELGRRA